MKLTLLMIATTLLSGCATATLTSGDAAICDATRQTRAAHAQALVDDGGPRSLVTGQRLISQVDAGCSIS